MKGFAIAFAAIAALLNGATHAATVIRVNVGGPAYTDSAGQLWAADSGYNTGNPYTWPSSTPVAGTSDPALYRSYRWDSLSAPEMVYSFPVPNGGYQVKLHFAEMYEPLFAVGRRIFDVRIENAVAIANLDIFAQAGARTALVKTVTTSVSDGRLDIAFVHRVDNPKVNAIEIVSTNSTPDVTPPGAPGSLSAQAVSASQINLGWGAARDNVGVASYELERCTGTGCSNFSLIARAAGTSYINTGLAASTTYAYRVRARDAAGNAGPYTATVRATSLSAPVSSTAIRVNVGGPAYTDSAGQLWAADSGYNTGNPYTWPSSTPVAGTSDPALYRSYRWDSLSAPEMVYSFPVPNGGYQVKLHFAEMYEPLFAVGRRIFDVRIENAVAIANLDIFAQAGARTALVKTVTTSVSDGRLDIAFVHRVDNPKVNAIEIIAQAATPSIPPPGNRAPTISGSPSTTATVGSAYLFQPSASDPDGDPLSFSIQNKPSWASFSSGTGRLSGTPTASNVGSTSNIVISVSDGKGGSASLAAFTLTVDAAANRPPTITGTPPTSVNVGAAYSFTPTGSDPDGDTIAYGIANKPAWATFDTATGRLSGTPAAANVGTTSNIVISVADGKGGSATLPAFSITVNSVTTGSATLTWTAPTQNEDGTTLTNLAGYRIRYGTSSGALTQTIQVANPGLTTYVVDSLAQGTWYFAMTSYTSAGLESAQTNVVSKTIQ
jgi:hypothetical protein